MYRLIICLKIQYSILKFLFFFFFVTKFRVIPNFNDDFTPVSSCFPAGNLEGTMLIARKNKIKFWWTETNPDFRKFFSIEQSALLVCDMNLAVKRGGGGDERIILSHHVNSAAHFTIWKFQFTVCKSMIITWLLRNLYLAFKW